ncbi:MAG: AbrB/MazE/SpoVT family DNA-binding domain-containing protein [Anaerolineales bacterium]
METVTNAKGQITIPSKIRKQLGIRMEHTFKLT